MYPNTLISIHSGIYILERQGAQTNVEVFELRPDLHISWAVIQTENDNYFEGIQFRGTWAVSNQGLCIMVTDDTEQDTIVLKYKMIKGTWVSEADPTVHLRKRNGIEVFQNNPNQLNRTMKSVLQEISQKTFSGVLFSPEQLQSKWLGDKPATAAQVKQLEKNLGVSLPQDYIDFITTTNGFITSLNGIKEPTFLKIEQVDYLINIDEPFVSMWKPDPYDNYAKAYSHAIMVAGSTTDVMFLLIPPGVISEKWEYWRYSDQNLHMDADEFDSLEQYFSTVAYSLRYQKQL